MFVSSVQKELEDERLIREVRAALVKLLSDDHGISPTSDENKIAGQTIEATSAFESQPLERVRWQDLDDDVIRRLLAAGHQERSRGDLDVEGNTVIAFTPIIGRDSFGRHGMVAVIATVRNYSTTWAIGSSRARTWTNTSCRSRGSC